MRLLFIPRIGVVTRALASAPLLIALATNLAAAQSVDQNEFFFGYSLLNAKTDSDLDRSTLHGGNLAFFYAISEGWGLVLDVSGHGGTVDAPEGVYGVSEIEVSQLAIMTGVRKSGLKWGRLRLAARALIGLTTGSAETDLARSLWVEETGFAAALGGTLMLDVSDTIAIRLIQPNLFLTTVGDETQLGQRLSTGLVVKFGDQQRTPWLQRP
jgi:hypothetical protein